jgi:hypothetical protein
MPTTQMTIKLINQPGSTGRGSIVGTDDQRLGIFPEKAGLFEVGKTYEIDYTETDRNGRTLRNVKNAKQVAASPPASEPFVSGAYRPSATTQAAAAPASNGNGYYRPTSPQDSERMFVCSLMNAFIQAGKIEPEQWKVITAINVLRTAYQKTFGFDDRIFTPSEAGRPRMVAAE